MGKKEIMRKRPSSRMEGETPTGAPEVMEATGAPHEEATPSPPRRDESRPTVGSSASGGPIPTTGTTQTPTIPMDVLEKFVQGLRPDLDLSQTLARLAAELTTPKPVQPAVVPTLQPIAVTTNPNTRTTEPSTTEKAQANPTPSNPSQTLASLTAVLPSSNPTEPAPSQPISQPLRLEIPIADNEEGGGEWFDDVAEIESPMEEKGEEEVYSGATEVLSEGGTEVMKAGDELVNERAVNREGEVEQPIHTEVMKDGAEMVKAGEPNKEEEVEQGIRTEVVETNLVGDRIENVVIVTDGQDEAEKEPPREMAGQGIVGHGNSLAGNVVGALVRRRRLLVDEASEEEEEDVLFQPIGGQHSQRRPASEELLVYKKRQFDLPAGETVNEGDRERRKRKGKEVANPAKKKMKQPSLAVVIKEPNPDVGRTGREEESDEEEALRWERRTKKRNDEAQSRPGKSPEEARPQLKKTLIRLDRHLLSRMVKFNDPKRDDECERSVTTAFY